MSVAKFSTILNFFVNEFFCTENKLMKIMEIALRRVHDVEASQFTVLANSPGLMTIISLYR